MIHKNTKETVIEFTPISSRTCTIRITAKPLNIFIIQIYSPTSDYTDEQMENVYSQLQSTIDSMKKKDMLIVQGDWNATIGKDSINDWSDYYGTACNTATNDRGLRLLEFASYNDLIVANTLGKHKQSIISTFNSPNGKIHNQIDYILIKIRFRSGINVAKTRVYNKAAIGSDNDLVMMYFKQKLKYQRKLKSTRINYNMDRLKNKSTQVDYKEYIEDKLDEELTNNENENIKSTITALNRIIHQAATEKLGFSRKKNKPWITDDILELCDERRKLKPHKNER